MMSRVIYANRLWRVFCPLVRTCESEDDLTTDFTEGTDKTV